MKLSELVAFRNRLNKLSTTEPKSLAQSKLDIIMHAVENPYSEEVKKIAEPFTPDLYSNLEDLYCVFDKFSSNIDRLKKQIHEQITEHEKQWFQESYRLFELAEDCETTDQILYGRNPTGEKSEQTIEAELTLQARLSNYANWRWAGMIIRPGVENHIDSMVGCDPLYIIDRSYDLLLPCLKKFPKLYQNRLRPYTTNDWSDRPILEKIPNNQFGVCLAYNVFNHRPLEIIRRYMEEIYLKLKPGGALLMTYNDCDRTHGVRLVEQFAASYTPGYLVRDLARNIGFKQIYTWDDGGPSVWLELQKPGELISYRGGQTISVVAQIDNYLEDVDFHKRRYYNNGEVVELQTRARQYNIGEDIIQSLKPFDLKVKIDEIVKEKLERERLNNLRQTAKDLGIDPTLPNLDELVNLEKRKNVARSKNIDISLPTWEKTLDEVLLAEETAVLKQHEKIRLENVKKQAIEKGVDITQPNWEKKLTEILLIEEVKARQLAEEKLKKQAKQKGIDVTQPNWELMLVKELEREELERKQRLEELERQRIEQLHNRAREKGVDPTTCSSEEEIMDKIAQAEDVRKKEELIRLRQRAMELKAGDPNLIKYGYSAEKLKQLIKEKEEKQ